MQSSVIGSLVEVADCHRRNIIRQYFNNKRQRTFTFDVPAYFNTIVIYTK